MISVMLSASDDGEAADIAQARIARSLGWLVSAVVGGIVRDVVIAAPPRLALRALAERVGCVLVEEDRPFHAGLAACRCDVVLVLRAGYRPLGPLADEIDGWAQGGAGTPMRVAAAPRSVLERLWPDLAPVVGLLATKEACRAAPSFRDLARRLRTAPLFGTRLEPIT